MKPLEVKVKYFFRSAFTRETVGYLPGSVQADLDSVDPGENAIFLVDDGTDETLCRGNVSALHIIRLKCKTKICSGYML